MSLFKVEEGGEYTVRLNVDNKITATNDLAIIGDGEIYNVGATVENDLGIQNQSSGLVYTFNKTGTPSNPTDIASKAYVDSQVEGGGTGDVFLPLTGGTMSGDINMNSNTLTNVKAPVNDGDVATKSYVDRPKGIQYLTNSGSGVMVSFNSVGGSDTNGLIGYIPSGSTTLQIENKLSGGILLHTDNGIIKLGDNVLDVRNCKVSNVADPTADQDAATKEYVDNAVAGGSSTPQFVSGSLTTSFSEGADDTWLSDHNVGDLDETYRVFITPKGTPPPQYYLLIVEGGFTIKVSNTIQTTQPANFSFDYFAIQSS